MFEQFEKSGIILKYSFFNLYQGTGYSKSVLGGYHG